MRQAEAQLTMEAVIGTAGEHADTRPERPAQGVAVEVDQRGVGADEAGAVRRERVVAVELGGGGGRHADMSTAARALGRVR